QPVIHRIENGAYHRDDQKPVRIIGEGFRDTSDLKLFVDQYPVSYNFIDEYTIEIPAAALAMYPLAAGQHHIKLQDNQLEAEFLGALVTGEELSQASFRVEPQTADLRGGHLVRISSSHEVILPGAKVIMRSGDDVIHTLRNDDGVTVVDLKDDVVTLKEFTFRLPTVNTPQLYRIYLLVNGQEIYVGNISYTLPEGRSAGLPNYPPHVIGGADIVDDVMYVGVRAGAAPTSTNRFLMPYGFEIFDISIWENPIRLSQLRTDAPVTGVEVVGNTAYLAATQEGLLVVDVKDPRQPLRLTSYPAPGHRVTDVTYDPVGNMLAASYMDDFGSGFIRFFDLSNDELNPPLGYNPIIFSGEELQGQPLDVKWHDQK